MTGSRGEHSTRVGKVKLDFAVIRAEDVLANIVHKIGHEIGNPLTSIISLGTILERFSSVSAHSVEALPPEKIASYAGSIIDEAWRISSLTEKLVLTLTNRRGNPVSCDVGKAIQRSLSKLKNRRGVDSDYVFLSFKGEHPFEVYMDSDQLLALITELITNAFTSSVLPLLTDAEEAGENPADLFFDEPPIHIEVTAQDGSLVLAISNVTKNPCSIPDLSDVFQPLVTGMIEQRYVGIGLTMVAKLLSRVSGNIEVEERPVDGGFKFTTRVTFASEKNVLAHKDSSGERSEAEADMFAAVAAANLGAEVVIILAEDEPTVASAVKKILEVTFSPKTQLTCHCVSGADAVQMIERGSAFDALLCDLNLAGMSGRHVLETLLMHRPEEAEKFAFITGDQGRRETQLYLETTNRAYLHKPFQPEELVALVLSLLAVQ